MKPLVEKYRAVHEQAFIPVLADDHFDTRTLVEGAAAAGCKAVEITLRRHDAPQVIRWARKQFPDLVLLVGSTLEDDVVVKKMRRQYPQLLTLDEMVEMGVDGFVSMTGWSAEGIRKYSATHLLAPTAMTIREAMIQLNAGAHFIKMLGPSLDLVRMCRGSGTAYSIPILITGGMDIERMPDAVAAGAMLTGSGFERTMAGEPPETESKKAAEATKKFWDAMRAARDKAWPEMAKAIGGPQQAWLDSLPHYHPF